MVDKVYLAFKRHKQTAAQRGIEFLFEFEQWCRWWERSLGLDWLSKRGKGCDKYVMARHEDKGPYAWWNVKCILGSENSREANQGMKNSQAILTEEEAHFIKHNRHLPQKILMTRFGVSREAIQDIRRNKKWKHID